MRSPWKIIGWVLAFSACFTVGAVIAAHSDPFPPGVVDPGATLPPTKPPKSPAGHVLVGSLRLQTIHNLYVGGACRTNWKGTLILDQDSGKIIGTGAIDVLGGLHCDFSVIQVQVQTVNVTATGSVSGQRVEVFLKEAGRDPLASSDFGGFTHTLRFLKLLVPLDGTQQVHASVSDGDRGTYVATGTFTVTCKSGC